MVMQLNQSYLKNESQVQIFVLLSYCISQKLCIFLISIIKSITTYLIHTMYSINQF